MRAYLAVHHTAVAKQDGLLCRVDARVRKEGVFEMHLKLYQRGLGHPDREEEHERKGVNWGERRARYIDNITHERSRPSSRYPKIAQSRDQNRANLCRDVLHGIEKSVVDSRVDNDGCSFRNEKHTVRS